MTVVIDPRTRETDTWRTAAFAHLAASHERLGGLVEGRGPLRLFANPTYDWTFFNTARQMQAVQDRDIDALIQFVMRFYESRQLRPAWDVSDRLASPTLATQLMHAGFILDRCESLMALPLSTADGGPQTADRRPQTADSSPQITDYGLRNTEYAIRMTDYSILNPQSSILITPIFLNTLDYFVHTWRQGFAMGPDTPIGQVRALFSRDLESGWDFWCAWQGDRPVGTLAAFALNGVVQVANVSTLPALRRQGVATRLMRHAYEQAVRRGDALIYLHATAGSAAERLYRRLGFQVLDEWRTFVYARGVWGV